MPHRILIFSKTTGYRHESIPKAVATIRDIAVTAGIESDATEDSAEFTRDNIAGYDALVFVSTTGELFDDDQRAALERFVRSGGGFVGIHAASNGEPGWPFFGELIRTRFDGHPHIQQATIFVADADHLATAHLPNPWVWTDEWYNFTAPPDAWVLLTVDEATYEGGAMGAPHPLAWCHEVGDGRCFYTALGHADEYYDDPAFREHLLGGLQSVIPE